MNMELYKPQVEALAVLDTTKKSKGTKIRKGLLDAFFE